MSPFRRRFSISFSFGGIIVSSVSIVAFLSLLVIWRLKTGFRNFLFGRDANDRFFDSTFFFDFETRYFFSFFLVKIFDCFSLSAPNALSENNTYFAHSN